MMQAIRKYQNELILLAGLLVLLIGFFYQRGMQKRLDVSLERSRTAALQVTEAKTLQKVWSTKGLKKKVANLRTVLPSTNVESFDLKKKKLTAHYAKLTGKELNKISTEIASLPLQIQEFAITRSGKNYDLRCTCSW